MGRSTFTRTEAEAIKTLLREIRRAERSQQKTLRGRLRTKFYFYISDFATDQQGFTASDVDALIQRRVITISDESKQSNTAVATTKVSTRPEARRPRDDAQGGGEIELPTEF